ncbi:MAG: hypothetical protein U0694_17675 [Anaerolineae bacterium]
MRARQNYTWAILLSVLFMLALLTQGLWAQEATPEADDSICALGPGFWANHPDAWAVTTLTLGSQSYSQAELTAILGGGGDGDASLILARHLIAAKLNVANGISSAVVDSLIAAGDALLAEFDDKLPYDVEPSSADGQSMTALAGTLDSFNSALENDDCETTPTPESTSEITPEVTPEATPDDDDDLEITIIIEGPVEEIDANIIVIYGFHIEVDPNDPILVIIQIGDVVRIEGDISPDSDGSTILIIAIVVIIVDIDVVVGDDGSVWRDNGNCDNPPPPWAPANGWRRRCETQPNNGGSGRGMGGS